MMASASNLPRVVVVYPYLPHYRYGVFHELDQRLDDLLFVTGGQSRDGSIAVTPAGTFRNERKVENCWFGPALWQKGLGRVLRDWRPDIVIFWGDAAHLSTYVQAIWSRLIGRKVYFWTIGWHKPDAGVRRLVRLAFYRIANGLLLYGNHGRAIGKASGYPESRMEVIYNSYGSRAEAESVVLSPESLPSGDRPVIGAVIRLSTGKGLLEIIEAIANLRDEHGIHADALIVGEGPERDRLEKLASELGVKLFLPGAVYNREDLNRIYERLTVTVVPRAAGLTVLQSLAAGTPVVTISDPYQQMPEFEAIEDGVTGSLVDNADGESIAKACATWILKTSQDGSEKIKNTCKSAVNEHWSPEAQGESIVAFLHSQVGRE